MALHLSRHTGVAYLTLILRATTAAAQAPGTATPTQAMTAATRIADPTQRLSALEKVRADFPTYTPVDQQILTTLVGNFADRQAAIGEVFDRMIARIPPSAGPDVRLTQLLAPINVLVARSLMLDRSERLMLSGITAFDLTAYTTTRLETAKRLGQPAPTKEAITATFNASKARGLETIGLIRLAKGDTAGAETPLKEAWRLVNFGTAANTLIAVYVARNDYASAEKALSDAIVRALTPPPTPPVIPAAPGAEEPARPVAPVRPAPSAANPQLLALANLYLKKGDDARADTAFRAVLSATPTNRAALVGLAKLEDKHGNTKQALDHIAAVALTGALGVDDDAAFHSIFSKVNGSDAGLQAYLDDMYNGKFPNPITVEPWKPSPTRSDRVTLVELFTGSACPPCVGADVALDAVMERYPQNAVITIVYDANIPGPDPMVVSGGEGRRQAYGVRGVPTLLVDGGIGLMGGGSRGGASTNYGAYTPRIDEALKAPPGANLTVSATGHGDSIDVTARVSKLPAGANISGVRLNLMVVEQRLTYTGENGVRFHPMVVRAAAGDHGSGIPLMADGTIHYSFSLSEIKDDVARTLANELDRRAQAIPPGGAARNYAAEGHAYTAIDTTKLRRCRVRTSLSFIDPAPS